MPEQTDPKVSIMPATVADAKALVAPRPVCHPTPMDVYRIRRDNLRRLTGEWGGPTSLAKKLGHSNGSYLAQLVGPNPTREISEKVAREMEATLGLPLGWMDQEHGPSKPLDEETLNACVRAVATCLQDAELRPAPAVYGTLVQLVYEHARLTGRIDEFYVKRLMELLR